MIEKFNKLETIKKYYELLIDINNLEEFEKYYNQDIDIIHKCCENNMKIKLKYLFTDVIDSVRMSSLSYLDEYFEDNINMKCPKCLQDAKNKYFNQQLENKFKGKYILDGEFKGLGSDVCVKHIPCGTRIKRNAGKILSNQGDTLYCSTCSKLLNRQEKLRQKNIMKIRNKYTFDKDISDIYIFKEHLDKEIGVTHNKCGHKFNIKLNNFFNAKMHSVDRLVDVEDSDDVICPKCMQEFKNKYFQDLLDKKTNSQYELVGNYISAKDKVEIRHKVCGKMMKISASNVFCEGWAYKCNYCSSILSPSEKRKFDVCNNLKNDYIFPFDISEPYLFKNNLNNVIEIKHKKCNSKFEVKLSEFNKLSVNKDGHLGEYIENIEDVKCPHCFQNIKNNYFKDILYKIYGDEYSLSGNYLSTKEDVSVVHNPCGNIVTLTASIITRQRRKNTALCSCSEDTRQKEIQKEKNNNFIKKMHEEGIFDFELLDDYIDRTTEINFRHTTCGYEFSVSPENFLKRVNKCPNCTGNNRIIFKDQEEKNEVFQRRLNEKVSGFRLVGDYTTKLERVTLYHEKCHKEFTVDMTIFEASNYKCPYCETKKYKYSRDISLKEKIKCFEREWNYEYKILTPFINISDTATLRHKRCGKTFDVQISNVVNRADKSTVCPHCELEKRKKAFLEKLHNKFGDSYRLVGEYVTEETPTVFEHVLCKKQFTIKPFKLLTRVLEYCPECKDEVYRLNNFNKFKTKLIKKYGNQYSMITEYKNHETKMLFKHKDCETLFWETPSNMLKKDIPCTKCSSKDKWIPIEEVNKRIQKANGNKFRIIGNYRGTENSVSILCNDCGYEMDLAPVKLFRARKCPECDVKKRKEIFLDKLHKKFGDAYKLHSGYTTIDSPAFFIHKSCGVKFEIIPKQLLDKKVECCPECKEERMKEHYRNINSEKFKNKLTKKYKDKYKMLSEYIDLNEEILFEHRDCGHKFKSYPEDILKKEVVCEKCVENKC